MLRPTISHTLDAHSSLRKEATFLLEFRSAQRMPISPTGCLLGFGHYSEKAIASVALAQGIGKDFGAKEDSDQGLNNAHGRFLSCSVEDLDGRGDPEVTEATE